MRIHFVGVGGIGVSALAQYYLFKGFEVSGSDLSDSEMIGLLRKKGAKISVGKHKERNLPLGASMVVYSPAADFNNPEIEKAKKLGIKIISYPELLGDLTREYFTIAVSGTHGKSTTSAMISLILAKSGLDPTVIIGTKLKEFGNSNFRAGKSKYLVIEADEYKKSFLNYSPQILVLTNIEEDHLDYYGDIKNILKAFKEYLRNINKDGFLAVNYEDANIQKVLSCLRPPISGKFSILGFKPAKPDDLRRLEKTMKVPGSHNVDNALAALSVARVLGISDKKTFNALSEYQGSWRRFEVHELRNVTLISDYAHHPTEIEKTLEAVKSKFPKSRIICVFQPHQYERTFRLFDKFVKVLGEAPVDEIILCEVYDVAGRENQEIKKRVNSKKLKNAIGLSHVKYKKTLEDAEVYVRKTMKKSDIVVIMGAGDIYNLLLKLKSKKG